ncbi:MAG: hypothetical protein LBH19_06520 [Dysgonamonadaceae bacterium]|jgi:hypothetical protein|nr:hypothetical protein [Dysgonamonadaceae bacterium]
MRKQMDKIRNIILKIIIVVACLVIAGIQSANIYRNSQKDIDENYIKTDAKIIFVAKSGNGIYTRTLITVQYNYENKIYNGTIRRVYKNDGYYKIGDEIAINVNKNNPKDIK